MSPRRSYLDWRCTDSSMVSIVTSIEPSSFLAVDSTASSSVLSADRASPLATFRRNDMASSESVTLSLPSPWSSSEIARLTISAMSSSVSGSSVYTLVRESRGEITSKDGFSVVAPMSLTVPSSTWGRSASCCDLENRCISSRKRIVRRPV